MLIQGEYTAETYENQGQGTTLTQITATDQDEPGTLNSQIRYAIHSGQDKVM